MRDEVSPSENQRSSDAGEGGLAPRQALGRRAPFEEALLNSSLPAAAAASRARTRSVGPSFLGDAGCRLPFR